MTLVSQSEYARLHGVSRQAVHEWVAKGIVTLENGKIDTAQADEALREQLNPARSKALAAAQPAAVPPPSAPSAGPDPDTTTSFHVAKTLQVKYDALRSKLKYEQDIGQLVPASDVERMLEALRALVSAALEQLPGELAARIADSSTYAQRLHVAGELRDGVLGRMAAAELADD